MTAKYKLLSYPLSEHTPLYADISAIRINPVKEIARGDSCNTFELSFSNHAGSHIDAPRHCYETGRAICDYKISDFIFSSPCVVNCPKDNDGLVEPKDLDVNLSGSDILLVRTDFYKYRGDPRYRLNNPGIAPETAELLRTKYPNIRALGIDSISISPFQKRQLGRLSHRILLNPREFSGEPVLLVEDLNLAQSLDGIKKVYVIPYFIEKTDSSIVTVIGDFC